MLHREKQCNLASKYSNKLGHAGPRRSWSNPRAVGARAVILAVLSTRTASTAGCGIASCTAIEEEVWNAIVQSK